MNGLYEEEQRLREEQHDMTVKSEKRANDLHLEIEEVKAQLEQVSAKTKTKSCNFNRSIYPEDIEILFVCLSITAPEILPRQRSREAGSPGACARAADLLKLPERGQT